MAGHGGAQTSPRFSDAEILRIADQVSRVAESTGLGFVLARLVTDQVIEGVLNPDDPGFATELLGRALDLLLGNADAPSKNDRAMLIALALVPRGLPLGRVWTTAARAVDAECGASEQEQLGLVLRLARFLTEEREGAQVRYRVFHEVLRGPLKRAPLDAADGPIDDRELEARGARLRASLVELVLAQTEAWQAPDRADPYLIDRLPQLLAADAEEGLIRTVTEDAPVDVRRLYARALLAAAADALAVGDNWLALLRAQNARDVIGTEMHDEPLFVDGQLAMCDALVTMDDWRNARDIASGELERAWNRVEKGLHDPVRVGEVIRSARQLVRALGVGAFDAEEGLDIADDTLERLTAASRAALAPNAEHLAELLLSYSDSLRRLSDPAELLAPLNAAVVLLQAQVQTGRADLWLDLSNALAHLGIASAALDRPEGLELLRQSVAGSAPYAPFSPVHLRQMSPLIGELVQHLGISGLHHEAVEWLDWTLEAYRPAAEVDEWSADSVIDALLMRAAVLAVLSRDDEALRDAQEAVDRSRASAFISTRSSATGTLALRLLDRGRYEEVAELASLERAESPSPSTAPPWWAEMAHANLLADSGNAPEAIEILESQLLTMERPEFDPRRGIHFGTFIDFEASLRVGAALADAQAALGRGDLAAKSLARAASIFQGRRMMRFPRSLLHVPSPVLERYAVGFLRPPEALTPPEASQWIAALEALRSDGRRGLEEWALTGLSSVDVKLRLTIGSVDTVLPRKRVAHAPSTLMRQEAPTRRDRAVQRLVQKSLSVPDISHFR